MPSPDVTCWSVIRDAAGGDNAARERFVRVYVPVVKGYLAARWRTTRCEVDDAVQDVFVECFRHGGLLEKANPERSGFRAFLLGAVRNVARRHEERVRPIAQLPPALPDDDTGPAEAFDRAWAISLLKEAARVQEETAASHGSAAVQRVELLRLRFQGGLPIREIARQWKTDPAKLHHEYATARDEFRTALREVIAFHHPGEADGEIDRACHELLVLIG